MNIKINDMGVAQNTLNMLVNNIEKLKMVVEMCADDNAECQRQLEKFRRESMEELGVLRLSTDNKLKYLESLAHKNVVTKYV
jgi:hypothetical protein